MDILLIALIGVALFLMVAGKAMAQPVADAAVSDAAAGSTEPTVALYSPVGASGKTIESQRTGTQAVTIKEYGLTDMINVKVNQEVFPSLSRTGAQYAPAGYAILYEEKLRLGEEKKALQRLTNPTAEQSARIKELNVRIQQLYNEMQKYV